VAVSGPRGIAVLGATGSIGGSTLNVVSRHRDRYRIVSLAAGRRAGALSRLAEDWEPDYVVLANPSEGTPEAEWAGDWRYGPEALREAAEDVAAPIVVNALVGFAGLESTVAALRAGKRLALANKESLVVGGELVLEAVASSGGELIPVDSEHSAILQCIADRPASEVRRVILTASGGPFRDWPAGKFDEIRAEDALAHPTWSMGDKITVDSATLANKALEVIETHLLFGSTSTTSRWWFIPPPSCIRWWSSGTVRRCVRWGTRRWRCRSCTRSPARSGSRTISGRSTPWMRARWCSSA
jgi:1-deoxy-D-xylulose-5-phosphate reductoisomerase